MLMKVKQASLYSINFKDLDNLKKKIKSYPIKISVTFSLTQQ